ncbi:MAG: NAD-dependent epimerase/dehydratase family protein [Candidatus Nezhaarchaeota archaeon]|nr:NAD-dependent epimerase/dehydratase family protein [Candidatus Nezhaarchaeota archaeon]
MRVLVTGGCGFIGSHLVGELAGRGFTVTVLDDLSLGSPLNVEGLDVELVKGDSELVSSMDGRFDVVFHNGIPSSSPMYKGDPQLVSKAVRGVISVLEYARRRGAKVVLASTSSLYNGNPTPWREGMEVKVTDLYTEARLYCERLCELYSRLYGVECVALRYFSVFGEREEHKGSYANVLTQMLWSALRGQEFAVYGDGRQSRDLIYVGDVVEANLKAADFNDYSAGVKFEVFNVGSGRAYSFNEMAGLLRGQGLNVKVIYRENPVSNYVWHTLADMKKSAELLEFRPRRRVEEVLPRIVSYYARALKVT